MLDVVIFHNPESLADCKVELQGRDGRMLEGEQIPGLGGWNLYIGHLGFRPRVLKSKQMSRGGDKLFVAAPKARLGAFSGRLLGPKLKDWRSLKGHVGR